MKEKLYVVGLFLVIAGLVLTETSNSWGAGCQWYKFSGLALISLGISINTYVDFPHPFKSAKKAKKLSAIFRICLLATIAIWLVYELFMLVMNQPTNL